MRSYIYRYSICRNNNLNSYLLGKNKIQSNSKRLYTDVVDTVNFCKRFHPREIKADNYTSEENVDKISNLAYSNKDAEIICENISSLTLNEMVSTEDANSQMSTKMFPEISQNTRVELENLRLIEALKLLGDDSRIVNKNDEALYFYRKSLQYLDSDIGKGIFSAEYSNKRNELIYLINLLIN